MASGFTHDILVSYVAADRKWGERIASALGQKYKVYKLEDGASANPALLSDALSWADRIVPVFSKSSVASKEVAFWHTLNALGSFQGKKRFLPLRIDDCRFPGVLGAMGALDLTSVPSNELNAHLLDVMRTVMGK